MNQKSIAGKEENSSRTDLKQLPFKSNQGKTTHHYRQRTKARSMIIKKLLKLSNLIPKNRKKCLKA
jgi:hypothetical protein